MVYCVGLTGNGASGKSTVAGLFGNLGIERINADQIAKELCAQGQKAYQQILAHFGNWVRKENGDLDRKILRDIIFSNAQERLWLENLLHPLIRQEIASAIKACKSPYCMIEIPLLTDKSMYPYLNRILVVSAPYELQISRLMQRDSSSREQAIAILSAQPDLESRQKIADDLIVNDADLETLKTKIQILHNKYLQESKICGKMSSCKHDEK